MDSYYGMLQWYQSRRSSAAHRKNEQDIEIETENYPLRHDNHSAEIFDAKLRRILKMIDELIDSNKKAPQKMIDDGFSPGNPSDYSLNHVSIDPQKIGCEEASIEEPSLAANDEESQPFIEAGAVLDFQVSLQTKNSKSYKEYKHYSAVELDERRERGLCLWCDEFWYIGHECCKKKLYVFEIDIDEDVAIGENNLMEPIVDIKLVEKIYHCDNQLIVDCMQKDSNELSNFVYGAESGSWEASEVLGNKYELEDNALQVYEEMSKKSLVENMADCMGYTICLEDEILDNWNDTLGALVLFATLTACWLDDFKSEKLMVIVLMNPSPKDIEALFNLLSRLRGLHQPWLAAVSKIHIVVGMLQLEENGDSSTYGTSLRLDSVGSMTKAVGVENGVNFLGLGIGKSMSSRKMEWSLVELTSMPFTWNYYIHKAQNDARI